METHPHCKPGEIFLGHHSHALIRMSVLSGIRQRTESGENVPLSGASNGNYSYRLATFAPIQAVRELQQRAIKAGGTLFDIDAITDPPIFDTTKSTEILEQPK